MTEQRPIEIGVCSPHGRDSISILPNEAYKLATLKALTFDGRPVYLHEFSVLGDEYARGRNGIVQQFKDFERDMSLPMCSCGFRGTLEEVQEHRNLQTEGEHNLVIRPPFKLDYLFWWDDDVILPPEVIPQLLSRRTAIASGVYFMRKPPFLPVAYYESTDPTHKGRFWNLDSLPDNALMEVDAVGHGCVLIKREVYDAIQPPYYAWQDVYRDQREELHLETPPAGEMKPVEDRTMGEDLYFFSKARMAGYKVMLDTSVLCGHAGTFVYDASIFRSAEARYHKVAPEGRLNILMLAAPAPKPWDGNVLHNSPLGGSESMVGGLAEQLANRHHHVVYVVSGSAPNLINGVHYRPYDQTHLLAGQPWDIVIVSRWLDMLPVVSANKDVKRIIFWAHDVIPQRQVVSQIYANSNAFVTVSPFHAAITYNPTDPNNDDRMSEIIMPNGIDCSLFSDGERQPGKLVWTSNPNRGLFNAVRIFRKLRQRWPMLEFHIYGRAAVYGWGGEAEEAYLPPPGEPGVVLHEPLNKADLAKELSTAWAWFYPTSWPETSCGLAETPVFTKNGMKRLDTVVEGDLVLTHAGAFKPVTRVMSRPYRGKLIGVRRRKDADTLWFTPEHPFQVSTFNRRNDSVTGRIKYGKDHDPGRWHRLTWQPLGEITGRHQLLTSPSGVYGDKKEIAFNSYVPGLTSEGGRLYRTPKHTNWHTAPESVPLTEAFGRMIGLIASDGCVSRTGGKHRDSYSQIAIAGHERDQARIVQQVRDFFGLEPHVRPSGHGITVTISHRLWAAFFGTTIGVGLNKHLPDFVWDAPLFFQQAVMDGLMAGDGYVAMNNGSERSRYTSISPSLAYGAALLLSNLGQYPAMQYDARRRSYDVSWYATGKKPSHWYGEGCVATKIAQRTEIDYDGDVFNLEVEGDNSYVVGRTIVHNCVSALEAQAAGTPVICNPYGALTDTVKGGLLGYRFEPLIEQLMDPETYDTLSYRGKEWARLHDWPVISDRWEQVLRDQMQRYEDARKAHA